MMKTKSFLLAVAYAAMAFTFFACSGDDSPGDEGGSNLLSDLPNESKQVYLVETDYDDDYNLIVLKHETYKGSSDIILRIPYYAGIGCGLVAPDGTQYCMCEYYNGGGHECEYEEYRNRYEDKLVGKIQNGQIVSLNLPTSIDSKYFIKFEPCDDAEREENECNVSFPENLAFFVTWDFYVTVSGKSNCELYNSLVRPIGDGIATFYYVSKSGKVTGRNCYNGSSNNCYGYSNYDMNFSNGWNVVYQYQYNDNEYSTTDFSKTGGKLEWWIECDDD